MNKLSSRLSKTLGSDVGESCLEESADIFNTLLTKMNVGTQIKKTIHFAVKL